MIQPVFEITKSATFDAAHYIVQGPEHRPYSNMHGHSFRVEATVRGETQEPVGWVADFADLDAALKAVAAELDHGVLEPRAGAEHRHVRGEHPQAHARVRQGAQASDPRGHSGQRDEEHDGRHGGQPHRRAHVAADRAHHTAQHVTEPERPQRDDAGAESDPERVEGEGYGSGPRPSSKPG
jgi:6-pyruvoyl tetrahydropterin synthase/QueD family protein